MAEPFSEFYCHECSKNFITTSGDPGCPYCNSGFVEFLGKQTEESRTAGVGSSYDAVSTVSSSIPSSSLPVNSDSTSSVSTPTPPSAPTASSAAANAPRTTTTTTGATRSRNPINITIGASPIFRAGNDNPFDFFSMFSNRQDSPMETDEGEDPGDELLSRSQARRRTGSQVRSGQGRQNQQRLPNSNVIVLNNQDQNPRVSLERLIHEQISSIMQQHVATEGTDQGAPRQPQQQQQQQQGASIPTTSQSSSGSTQQQPRNVQVMHFPPVQIVMGGRQGQQGSDGSSDQQMPFPMLFMGQGVGMHGSPGDYAWGPQGLDNIISRLLANLEDTGPPPTEKAKLEALASVSATEEDLKECVLCSVCKEDFSIGETLVQLPCSHLYHNDCILPWLKLHDTCPTCRFHLNTEKYDDKESSTASMD